MAGGRKDPTICSATLPESFHSSNSSISSCRWRSSATTRTLKQELGLGHYGDEAGGCFHQSRDTVHRRLRLLISERETIPPSGHLPPRNSRRLPFPTFADP